MLVSRLLPLLSLAFSTSARSFFNSGEGQSPLISTTDDRANPVPGDNPLEFCEPPGDYRVNITNVDLSPNPPKAGQTLSIEASGTVKEKVEEGAYVAITVKYGLITLIKSRIDLCEQVKNVDLECPLEKGPLKVTKDVDLPNEIPPGSYTVNADVFTNKDERITCLLAKVRFSRG